MRMNLSPASTELSLPISPGHRLIKKALTLHGRSLGFIQSVHFDGSNSLVAFANKDLLNTLEASGKDFVDQAAPLASGKDKDLEELKRYDFEAVPTEIYVGNRVLSVVIQYFQDTGGAHPMTNYIGYNYGYVNGKPARILIADPFKPKTNLEDVVGKPTVQMLKDKGAMWFWVTDESLKMKSLTTEMLDNFSLTQTGLKFWFNPYEVGPYAQGFFNTSLKYADIRGYLRVPGPLADEILNAK